MSTLVKRYFFFILGSFVGKIIIQDISGGISVFKAVRGIKMNGLIGI